MRKFAFLDDKYVSAEFEPIKEVQRNCQKCGKTFVLKNIIPPVLNMPSSFLCGDCRKRYFNI